jgi:hypothetical protein
LFRHENLSVSHDSSIRGRPFSNRPRHH